MSYIYSVVIGSGTLAGLDVQHLNDSIKAAREWAHKAFGPGCMVQRVTEATYCQGCNCAPCAAGCRRRR